MTTDHDIHDAILATYSRAADCKAETVCCTVDYHTEFAPEELDHLPSEVLEKNFGCGVPAGLRRLTTGQVVLDLGPGVGRDVFIAARKVGSRGRVYGLDMNATMLEKARGHATTVARTLGYANVEFLEGRFDEWIPLADEHVDVIFSNCVMNLAQNKTRAYREMYRVLKPGAVLSFSDVVADRENPEVVRTHPQAVADCIGGVPSFTELRHILREAGFLNPRFGVDFMYRTGQEVLGTYFDGGEALDESARESVRALTYYSVNVIAVKPRFPLAEAGAFAGQQAMYHGPAEYFPLSSAAAHRFPAGEWVEVDDRTAWLLSQEPYAEFFTIRGARTTDGPSRACSPGCC